MVRRAPELHAADCPERLVEDLFVSTGYKARRTQNSHDNGIDAVAVRGDRITPVECVIQAKRYRELVPPRDLQALMVRWPRAAPPRTASSSPPRG